MNNRAVVKHCLALLALAAAASPGWAQTLETETAFLTPRGEWSAGTAYEYQTSSEGKEAALPFLVEYGLADRLELVIEPVAYTAIRPQQSAHATGAGDIETTLVWRLNHASGDRPLFALAGEVKIPTARNELIGTGKTDYAVYGIASQRFGSFDLHANLSYTLVGKPAGVPVSNLFGYAIAGTFHATPRLDAFAEFTGTTAASGGSDAPDQAVAAAQLMTSGAANDVSENPVTPELAGSERVATLGLGFRTRPTLLLFGSVSYDNLHATLLRLGYIWRIR